MAVRRLIAESRIAVIIRRVFRSRYTELYAAVFVALAILVFYGSSGEGQASLFRSWVQNYVEEKALAFDAPQKLSSSQLADMNSIYAASGGQDVQDTPAETPEAAAINQSAIVVLNPPDDGYIDDMAVKRSVIVEYEVQDGDLLSFIASDFGVSADSIMWANNIMDSDSIHPGQVLRIPPVSGVVHVTKSGETAASLAKKYHGAEDMIIAYNQLPRDGSIKTGEEVIIPDGSVDAAAPTVTTTKSTASSAKIAASSQQFSHLPNLGDYFKIPTTGYDWGRIHGRNGVDIANSCGTPVYAAAAGTVTVADAVCERKGSACNGGFGNYIKIAHPNGTETLYGHSSKLLVKAGQYVSRGQEIMLMGTTGRSTGCHLHFEVHGAHNPLAKK